MNIKHPYFSENDSIFPQSKLYRAFGKRALDVGLTLLALPFVVPIIAVLAFLVALDGGKPFYAQARIGKNGRVFRMWKLRSMVNDADACLERHLRSDPDLRREWESKQKLADDPRVTRLGQLLRSTSADELPQLFNVLIGDMSLVGPRPMMVSQKALYPGEDYYDLLPGITGPWQVSARHLSAFADRAGYDSRYNSSLSFVSDLRILATTVKVVGYRTGC
ncbi:MAG: sugar transferase [Sulfitobacter sp.]